MNILNITDKYERPFEKNRAKFVYEQFILPYFKSSDFVLEIGPGKGFYTDIIKPRVREIKCFDIDENNLTLLKKKGYETYLGDASKKLPFNDNSFDKVVALEVIEHLKDYENFINEISRVVSKDGNVLISTPNRNSLEGYRGKLRMFLTGERWVAWDSSHQKIFTFKEFKNLITKRFEIVKMGGYYFIPKTRITHDSISLIGTTNKFLIKFCFIIIVYLKLKK